MNAPERMAAGLPFRNFDDGLPLLHEANLHRLFLLNHCDPADKARRELLLRQAVPHGGENLYIQSPFHCDYGTNIYTGRNVYLNFGCVVLDVGRVTIGDEVMIGPGVHIYAVSHPVHPEPRIEGRLDYAADVTIGNNVWIGGGSIINPGVTIGENTVIGAGSVVTHDIPANVVAAGNPCRVLRPITEADRHEYRRGVPIDPDCPWQPK